MDSTSNPSAKLEARPWGRITEKLQLAETTPDRTRKALPVVALVLLCAAALGAWLGANSHPGTAQVGVPLVLLALGFLAETLPYYSQDKRSVAVGSVAFIPYAAALFCIPDARVVILVGLAQLLVQVWHRRSLIKSLFNAAQFILSVEVALACLTLIGVPQAPVGTQDFVSTMIAWGPKAAVVFFVLVVTNIACVGAVVSRVSEQSYLTFLQSSARHLGPITLLQVILALYLAWLASSLGAFGAAGMVLPMLAVRQLLRATIQLTKVTEELLDLMVAAIEARDPYTSGHSRRVAASAVTIAKALGLKATEVERVQVAALLHDVGKIHEEFARILAKEGRLTPEEWEIMKRHPVRSAELVGLVTTLKDVVPSVRHHHENWDGTGYPEGKAGESIPLASRIIMFADTLDAITTDRPYRKALEPEEAKSEFIKFRGKQFDPKICDLVISKDVWPQLYAAAKASRAADQEREKVNVVA